MRPWRKKQEESSSNCYRLLFPKRRDIQGHAVLVPQTTLIGHSACYLPPKIVPCCQIWIGSLSMQCVTSVSFFSSESSVEFSFFFQVFPRRRCIIAPRSPGVHHHIIAVFVFSLLFVCFFLFLHLLDLSQNAMMTAFSSYPTL